MRVEMGMFPFTSLVFLQNFITAFHFLVMCPDFFGRKCHFQAPEMIKKARAPPNLDS